MHQLYSKITQENNSGGNDRFLLFFFPNAHFILIVPYSDKHNKWSKVKSDCLISAQLKPAASSLALNSIRTRNRKATFV